MDQINPKSMKMHRLRAKVKPWVDKVLAAMEGQEPPDAIIDVGVGLGPEVDYLRKAFPDAQLFGLEPHPQVRTFHETKFPGKFWPVAASDVNGARSIYIRKKRSHSTSFYPSERWEQEEVTVRTRRLDTLLANEMFGRALLWVDVEGWEPQVIRGAAGILERVHWIAAELRDEPYGHGWPTGEWVQNGIEFLGYQHVVDDLGANSIYHNALFVRS